MSAIVRYPHLQADVDGQVRIEGTRYKVLHHAGEHYHFGWSAEELLAQHRPGQTPLRYDLLLPQGTAGTLDINGSQSVRVEADLPGTLRALPGVRTVKVAMTKPWLQG